jgi:hypothetical protein
MSRLFSIRQNTEVHDLIVNALETWASYFANQRTLRTFIDFLHVGGLLAGGGAAIFADRITLMSRRLSRAARVEQLNSLRGTHRFVLAGLAAVIVSGLLLVAADIDTFLYSKLFWTKMALFALLLVNGALLVGAERRAGRGDERAWKRLTTTSAASIVLWFLTTLAGTGLPNMG